MNDVDKCYRLKLFLQQFFISTAVLNAQVPANSRIHIIEEFNRGAYDYLIATDALVDTGEEDEEQQNQDNEADDADDDDQDVDNEKIEEGTDDGELPGEDEADALDDEEGGGEGMDSEQGSNEENFDEGDQSSDEGEPQLMEEVDVHELPHINETENSKKNSSKPKSKREDAEYGVSRGIDFNGVGFVINFDFPATAAAYTHRVGRTARGGASGTSLSFVTRLEGAKGKDATIAARDARVLTQVRSQQPRLPAAEGDNILGAMAGDADGENRMQPAPLHFNLKELEGFRYRVEDTLKSVTAIAVKEFRAAEVKREILNSERLRTFFANNPNDLKALRHDKAILHPIRQKEHLKHIPEYLIPASMRSMVSMKEKKRKSKARRQGGTQEQRIKKSKLNDPLMNPSKQSEAQADDGKTGIEENEIQETRIFTDNEISNGGTTSGRKQWKMRHGKGKFNPKLKKKNSDRVPGTFMKSRKKF